jgi:hypothetical protein
MGALTANGGAIATATTPGEPVIIRNDGFWPDVDATALRASTRLTGNVTDERLRACVVEAMLWANDRLTSLKARQIADGWDKAEDIVGPTIAGESALVYRYRRAVASTVQADVAERYRDWDTTRAGDYRADFESAAADDFRRNANWAISDILGRGRTVVDLI